MLRHALLLSLFSALVLPGCFLFRREPARVVVRPAGYTAGQTGATGAATPQNDIPPRDALERSRRRAALVGPTKDGDRAVAKHGVQELIRRHW